MKKCITVLTVLLMTTAACQQNTTKIEREYIAKAIKEANIELDYQWIVVLPGMGCHGCIQEAEAFMSKHIADKRILFVLTKTSSLKILQQKTGLHINEHTNIFIDKHNLFDIPTDNRIYPCVVEIMDRNVYTHSFQSPQNDAFYPLEKRLW